jgi:uncharacterized protein YkwD
MARLHPLPTAVLAAALCALAGATDPAAGAIAHAASSTRTRCARSGHARGASSHGVRSFHGSHCPVGHRRHRSPNARRVHPGTLPGAGGRCANAALAPTARDVELVREATLCLINRERLRRHERPLRWNDRLTGAAQRHTESMAFGDYFEHDGPRGDTPLSRMRAAGYIYSRHLGYEIGENIGWGTLWLGTPRAMVSAWMASSGHRANILDPRFRDTGVGVSPHPPGSLAGGQPGGVYTQDFGVIAG